MQIGLSYSNTDLPSFMVLLWDIGQRLDLKTNEMNEEVPTDLIRPHSCKTRHT